MKILKLCLIFLVILGGVVGSFFLISGGNGSNPALLPTNQTEVYRKQFEEDWKTKGDWDESLFKSHCDLVKQLGASQNIDPLKDLNTSTAVEIVHSNVFKHWKSQNCKRADIDRYIKALNVIEKEDRNATSNPLVIEIGEVNKVYRRAINAAYQTISIEPTFSDNKWNSFNDYSNKITRNREEILNNPKYKQYLSNIKDVKAGLMKIPGRLTEAKKSFYTKLSRLIVEHYSEIPNTLRTREQLNNLRTVRNNYDNECSGNNHLNDFAKQFAVDVEYNERQKENENSYSLY